MILKNGLEGITRADLAAWGVEQIIFDSQEASPKTLFCALVGLHTDGHNFINEARERGCKHFLISNASFAQDNDEHVYILCSDTRQAMASLASIFYDAPSKKLQVIGVTGTDGKSTTSQLISQLIEAMGFSCGLISTVNIKVDATMQKNNLRQSTPEAPQIEEALSSMLQAGMQYAVVESTSHGLAQSTGRLSQISFAAGVFTNVNIEHLEFHKTVECYREDKANLFRNVAEQQGISVINALSEHVDIYTSAAEGSKILLYGKELSDLWASDIVATTKGFRFMLCTPMEQHQVELPLVGHFNIENALAALLVVATLFDVSPFEVALHLHLLTAPAGRMVLVHQEPFQVIVDYAHTPGAFERLLPHMRDVTKGKLVVLFGSGGERNIEKRPIQGKIADQFADVIFLTNEDPRLEDEFAILQDIAAGVSGKQINETLFMIPDRRKAIESAMDMCSSGDTLLLLGKGHEGSIIGPKGKLLWDEVAVAKEILAQRKA